VKTAANGEPVVPRGFRGGAVEALLVAAWMAPLLLPLGLVEFTIVAHSWLSSLEADPERSLITLATDARARAGLTTAMAALGGSSSGLLIAALMGLAWLAWARHRGMLARHVRLTRQQGPRVNVLVALLCGGCSCMAIEWSAFGVRNLTDTVTALRPTAPLSLMLLMVSQSLGFVGCGACLGATLVAARLAHDRQARRGALIVVAALGVIFAGTHGAIAGALMRRFDVREPLSSAAGEHPMKPTAVVVLARDRAWIRQVAGGVQQVGYDGDAARDVDAFLARRDGWTLLADAAEKYVIGERLLALDPDGARATGLRCVERRATWRTSYGLLVSLVSSAPAEPARDALEHLEGPTLARGPLATHLLAAAWARQGNVERARLTLADLRARGGEDFLLAQRSGRSLLVSQLLSGRIQGTLLIDGEPHQGRIGVLRTTDLFDIPSIGEGLISDGWLLRLEKGTRCDAAGRFSFEGLPDGEHALLVLIPGEGRREARVTGLARLELSQAVPSVDAGIVAVSLGAPSSSKAGSGGG